MAKIKFTEGPPRNDVYFGMLLITVVSMMLGCAALALEANEYEWDATPKARTKLTLPVDSIGAKSATTPATNTPAPAPMPVDTTGM